MLPNWPTLDPFRNAIEQEFEKGIINKPERIPAYEETMRGLREQLYKDGLDPANREEMYIVASTILRTANFMSNMFAQMCGDPHVLTHLRDVVVLLGYHVRDIGFTSNFPEVTNEHD